MLLKKQLEIATTHRGIQQALKPFEKVPSATDREVFVECRGRLAKASARYTPLLARVVWGALRPRIPRVLISAEPPEAGEVMAPRAPATRPLWCCLITRTVPTKSAEAKSNKAQSAIDSELQGHQKRGTWDVKRVRELKDWMEDPTFTEVLVGRVFVILGCKNSVMPEAEWRYRARAVFQGNKIHTISERPSTISSTTCPTRRRPSLGHEARLRWR